MKSKSILLEYSGMPLDALPEEVLEVVESDPALKRALEAQAEVAGWMQLKSYEQPDPALYGRVRHRVAVRLKQAPPVRNPDMWPAGLPAWGRMAAAVAVLFGLSVLTHREMLRDARDETAEPVAFSAPDPIPPENMPEFFQPDPFTTYVLAPPTRGAEDGEAFGLTRQLEADFEALGLSQTNPVEEVSFRPVYLPMRP